MKRFCFYKNPFHFGVFLPLGSASAAKSSTLPLPHQRPPISNRERERDRERDGYYSDRNELIRERERERERDRGYLSDHNSRFGGGFFEGPFLMFDL